MRPEIPTKLIVLLSNFKFWQKDREMLSSEDCFRANTLSLKNFDSFLSETPILHFSFEINIRFYCYFSTTCYHVFITCHER